jgi:hypothetical protein
MAHFDRYGNILSALWQTSSIFIAGDLLKKGLSIWELFFHHITSKHFKIVVTTSERRDFTSVTFNITYLPYTYHAFETFKIGGIEMTN